MRILLAAVNAKYIHSNPALYSLRQYAIERRPELAKQIMISEFTINQLQDEIIREIYQKKPDILAFSCYIWNRVQVFEAAKVLHLVLPDTPIWIGGPEVSFEDETFFAEHPYITGIMRGEGEKVFLELAEIGFGKCHPQDAAIQLPQIPDILWKDAAGTVHAGRMRTEKDTVPADDLPFLYTDMTPFQNRIIYYESSRGCPFSCSYCLSSTDRQMRLRSLHIVLKELRYFLDLKVPQVKFTDRTFNCRHDRTKAIWRYIIENDNGITNFHFELEASLLDEEELQLLGTMRIGLIQVELGVQSVNPKTLKAVRRNPDVSRIFRAARSIRKAGNMHLHMDLIAGLPYEDYESFRHSFQEVYRQQPDELQLGFLKLLRGSSLRLEAPQYGMIAHPQPPYEVVGTSWLTYDEILRLKDVEDMLEVYYNSGQFTETIRELEKYFPDPMALYEAIAVYYQKNGYFGLSHSRMRRIEILRDFAVETVRSSHSDMIMEENGILQEDTTAVEDTAPVGEQSRESSDRVRMLEIWDELTLYDLYLRENAKTRPSWAPDQKEWKKQIHDFWKQEETDHRYLPDLAQYDARKLSGMMHLEHFRYLHGKAQWILFDYSKRSPVSHSARTVAVEIPLEI